MNEKNIRTKSSQLLVFVLYIIGGEGPLFLKEEAKKKYIRKEST